MTDRMDLPQNIAEAREVIEVETKAIIIRNYTKTENGMRLNATGASKEIADLFATAAKKLLQQKA